MRVHSGLESLCEDRVKYPLYGEVIRRTNKLKVLAIKDASRLMQ